MSTPVRPIMRYHGGKWRLAPWILQHFPGHTRYVEPFAGAASVLLRKPRSHIEIINDLSGDIVNLFSVLRDPDRAKRLEELLRLTPFARAEFKAAYEHTNDPLEQARRLLTRSFMSYGSSDAVRDTCGFKGNCTSRKPSQYEWAEYPGYLRSFTERLQGVVVEHRDACELIPMLDDEDTLFYVDPPYVHSTQRGRRQKYSFELDDDDHRRLSQVLHACRGMVVLSGYPSTLYDELYGDWQRTAKRHVANMAKWTTECLWINPAARRQPSLFTREQLNEVPQSPESTA